MVRQSFVVDAVDQLQVGDAVTSTTAGIPNSTVINAINTGNKQVTLSNNLSQTMAVGSVLVTVSGADDQLDRGVKVHYNSSGTNQFGFFGYDRTGGADGAGAWTFIENATDTNTVFGVTGDRGTVVLGDLELDTDLEVQYGGTGASSFTSNGILYGNAAGELQVTAAANMASLAQELMLILHSKSLQLHLVVFLYGLTQSTVELFKTWTQKLLFLYYKRKFLN